MDPIVLLGWRHCFVPNCISLSCFSSSTRRLHLHAVYICSVDGRPPLVYGIIILLLANPNQDETMEPHLRHASPTPRTTPGRFHGHIRTPTRIHPSIYPTGLPQTRVQCKSSIRLVYFWVMPTLQPTPRHPNHSLFGIVPHHVWWMQMPRSNSRCKSSRSSHAWAHMLDEPHNFLESYLFPLSVHKMRTNHV